jgi:Ca2+-binding RTX toxin-like protein
MRAVLVAVGLVSLGLAVAAPPAEASDCHFNPSTHVDSVHEPVDVSNDVTFTRSGTNIQVDGANCGTVTTVDRVDLDMADVQGSLTLDLRHGQFAPGFTHEATGASEIEFDVTHVNGLGVTVEGGSLGQEFAVGERTIGSQTVTAFQLNGKSEVSAPDEDVIVHSTDLSISLFGDGGNDILTGQGTGVAGSKPIHSRMVISDGSGADVVDGGQGNDQMLATDDPDGADSYRGFGGFDEIDYSFRTVPMNISQDGQANDGAFCPGAGCESDSVGSDIEWIRTGSGGDSLTGGAGPQLLDAGGGDNTLHGGAGNDILTAGGGTDVFHGGPGDDAVSYESHSDGVIVSLDGTANDGSPGEDDNVETDVESVYGSEHADQITGGPGTNTLAGSLGNDVLDGGGGDDMLIGGGVLIGTVFAVADGSDVFLGGSGVDTVDESAHNGNLSLTIDNDPNDQVQGDPLQGVDNIHTDVENVIGGSGNDHITGSSKDNRLEGGAGNDTLSGMGGDDVLVPGAGNDTLIGGPGEDTASFEGSTAAITANLTQGQASGNGSDVMAGIEDLTGSGHGDTLLGSSGANTLRGGGGNDSLKGEAGNDRLFGESGNDTLDGGAGTDHCSQGAGSGSTTHCES